MLLLINRNTGQAYFFEPNGDVLMEHYRKLYALITLPNTYHALVTYSGPKPSEWCTTTFIRDTIDGFRPQAMQGPKETLLRHNNGTCLAWTTLFYHLFILHPKLSPNELLERMLAPKQRMHLGTIVARYSMYMIDQLDDMLSDSNGEDLDVAKIERLRKKAKANLEELTQKCNELLLKQRQIAKKQVCVGVEKASKYLLNECV
ncbi:uncharacterized protein ACA1_066230 [Acanthamoeba castellanii str. Neff]|uniref:Uncharacterized protein n=1 Tax=Acanthamoeba castellanii (strain ATCC 30010 / Neff) TaxID=1257118 RepID=L8H087_ACACF|nr:uncharacterized protein ACA1_066230 [Acanthamoeba castellanii str. Neff]ELR17801.1 hypothetical protein ACA1_066230 [Acanthamoeba castellanii str. Neff]